MKNLKELTNQELLIIDGGNWIYDMFYAFGAGCVNESYSASGSAGGTKYGGSWQY